MLRVSRQTAREDSESIFTVGLFLALFLGAFLALSLLVSVDPARSEPGETVSAPGYQVTPALNEAEGCEDEQLENWWDESACDEPEEEDDDFYTSPGDTPPEEWVPPADPSEPTTIWPAPPRGAVAKLRANGRTAVAPKSAPAPVKRMIKAANSLTRKPYKWGGGHTAWKSSGYDCSGAVSFVLNAGGLLDVPMVSGGLAKWGKSGKGRWVQVYAHKNHVFMVIAGLRFDTSGMGERGPRWRTEARGTKGFRLRHPAGL